MPIKEDILPDIYDLYIDQNLDTHINSSHSRLHQENLPLILPQH